MNELTRLESVYYNGDLEWPQFVLMFEGGVTIRLNAEQFWRVAEMANVGFYRARTAPHQELLMDSVDDKGVIE